MKYKGYSGRIRLDEEEGVFYGEVRGIVDVVTFQGASVEELRTAFQESVDDYLEFCEESGEEPDRPYSGKLLVRLSPKLHREAAAASEQVRPKPEHLDFGLRRTLRQATTAVEVGPSRRRACGGWWGTPIRPLAS